MRLGEIMQKHVVILIVVWVLGLSGAVHAEMVERMQFQGFLTDAEGQPLEGDQELVFALYGSVEGGEAIWTQTITVSMENGIFSVLLGSQANPLDETVFSGRDRWLGVAVGDEVEMTPRVQVRSVPYAVRVEQATNSVGDITPNTVSVGGSEVIDENGHWVGDPTGLAGPKGDQGDRGLQGTPGAAGVSVASWSADVLDCPQGGTGFSIGDGPDQFICNGSVGPKGDIGQQGETGDQGEQGDPGQPGSAGHPCWDIDGSGTCNGNEDADGVNGCTVHDCRENSACPTMAGATGTITPYTLDQPKQQICIYAFPGCPVGQSCNTYDQAMSVCSALQMDLCSYEQLQVAVLDGMTAVEQMWMSDITDGSKALYVNRDNDTTDFDGEATMTTEKRGAYCCRVMWIGD